MNLRQLVIDSERKWYLEIDLDAVDSATVQQLKEAAIERGRNSHAPDGHIFRVMLYASVHVFPIGDGTSGDAFFLKPRGITRVAFNEALDALIHQLQEAQEAAAKSTETTE